MNRSRILLLAVALVAGGLAAFLATRGDAPQTAQIAAPQKEVRLRVLVASRPIGVGERLDGSSVEWQDWPKGATRPEYITSENLPDAPEQMTGTVARFEIFTGEPIRQAKLVHADQGYLSAVLPQGMRAVSIGVTAESGAGGFIVPNDRVDVVLSRRNGGTDISETILGNVKVLAIGHRLGEVDASSGESNPNDPQSRVFDKKTIATLELTPVQAETVINAGEAGKLTLVLRSVADFAARATGEQHASQTITLIRAGHEIKVVSGGTNTSADASASAAPAAQTAPAAAPEVYTPAVVTTNVPVSGSDGGSSEQPVQLQ